MWQMNPVCSHSVGRSHSPQGNCVIIGPFVSHHTHALDRKQNCSRLPDMVVKVMLPQGVYEYMVGLFQNSQLLFAYLSQYSDSKTGTRKRMS
ncbi:hypothetical protein SDC9_174198 [bioreactor metagenome]|uniref:Uncharacterized protein n=1 Tax=bioreactor metagenome TaxID=1076179 RepID=A0A645GT28_9ZZZZ